MEFVSVNPADESTLTHWPVDGPERREALLAAAAQAQRGWAATPIADRSRLLTGVGSLLRERRAELGSLASREMGKPITEALAEVDKCAAGCEFFAEHGPAMLADEPIGSAAAESYVSYNPLGVVLAVMPWNFPYWQVFRHVAPGLIAGNGVLVKHAENTLGCAHAIVDAFRDAGAPDGLVSTVVVPVEEVAGLISDRRVAAVTLTGSTRAGAAVAAVAASVWKKTVLELGGSDAFVVLDDADVAAAARTAVRSRFQNTGQSCIAAKRFIVVREVADAFVDAFVAATDALVIGDPASAQTEMGPMARADLRAGLAKQLAGSIGAGAAAVRPGGPRDGTGYWFDPAVVLVTDRGLPVWREETFGPVAPISVVANEAEALAVANDSDYGLGGNVWTADTDRGKAFARQLYSGAAFVNGMTVSDSRLPFGGVKQSGYGRELSEVGIREFTNIQTVWVGPAQA